MHFVQNLSFLGYSVALSRDGRYLAVGGKDDNTNIGATWLYKTSINARLSFKIFSLGAIFDKEKFKRIVQRNIEEYLASIPRNDTVNGTEASIASIPRRVQDCIEAPFEFDVGPQGFTARELEELLKSATIQELFKGLDDSICGFIVDPVVIEIPTAAPTALPAALKKQACIRYCIRQFIVDNYSCRDKFILKSLDCYRRAKRKKKKCIDEALQNFKINPSDCSQAP